MSDLFAQPKETAAFHRHYYHRAVVVKWLGWPMMKCPLDLWMYQEIITEVQPELIIETGTAEGGSSIYLACLMDFVGKGRVVSIDVRKVDPEPQHGRLTFITASSTDPDTVAQVKAMHEGGPVMVILDSDHSYSHVKQELELYGDLVTPGSYLIVEDTNLGHEVRPDYGPGPREAVTDWILGRNDFVIDRSKERFLLTYNPYGYLKRVPN